MVSRKSGGLDTCFPAALVALTLLAACERHVVLHSDFNNDGPPRPKHSSSSALMTPAEIAEQATPAIVTIRGEESLGSGFIVRADGWIATNFHVLAGSGREANVVMRDGASLPVSGVIAIDPLHDLALLKIDRSDLPMLRLGESDDVKAGDRVVVIGHPLGLEDTVSDGLVSAVRKFEDLTVLQISAPIAPGSSGGPLFDNRGRVIGIATAISREGQNLGFAVPATYLKDLMKRPEPLAWSAFVSARQAKGEKNRPKRDVAHLDLSTLAGCREGDLRLLVGMIDQAIEVGAPLYNKGNVDACYHVYEGAAVDINRKLGPSCKGPRAALAGGRKKAASLGDASDQAWAMRDTFDALMDVVKRKIHAEQ